MMMLEKAKELALTFRLVMMSRMFGLLDLRRDAVDVRRNDAGVGDRVDGNTALRHADEQAFGLLGLGGTGLGVGRDDGGPGDGVPLAATIFHPPEHALGLFSTDWLGVEVGADEGIERVAVAH